MKSWYSEILGWYGAVALLLGYALISFGVIPAQGLLYQGMVLTGTAGLVVLSLQKRAYQPALLNAVSCVIAIAAIVLLLFASR